MFQKLKKLHLYFIFFLAYVVAPLSFAEQCKECSKLDLETQNLTKSISSYSQLKLKNEDFIKKPGVSQSALIKAQSNVMIIVMKLEIFNNQLIEIQEKKKVNQCATCPAPKKS